MSFCRKRDVVNTWRVCCFRSGFYVNIASSYKPVNQTIFLWRHFGSKTPLQIQTKHGMTIFKSSDFIEIRVDVILDLLLKPFLTFELMSQIRHILRLISQMSLVWKRAHIYTKKNHNYKTYTFFVSLEIWNVNILIL